ncbi:hypothetical protein JOQ06_028580, partial [Pogonophryne albipinna]
RNRTPVEYVAASLQPSLASLSGCTVVPAAFSYSAATANVLLSDLGHVTDLLDKNLRPGPLQKSKDRTIKTE